MGLNVQLINPFIQSAISMIKVCADIEFQRGKVNLRKGKTSELGPSIIVKLGGAVRGIVVYEFSEILAIKIVETMNAIKQSDLPRTKFDILLEETILEMGNLISGRAITVLSMEKIDVTISAPTLERESDKELINDEQKVLSLPLRSKHGDFIINLGIDGL